MDKTLPLIFAVTLNWNRPHDTITCLSFLEKQTVPNLHLLVVDNGSIDNSVALIQKAFPIVPLLKANKNLGFATGMNIGIRHAIGQGADYIFILNNDTVLAPDMIEQLLPYSHDNVGIIAPTIFYADDPDIIWSQGAKHHPLTLEIIGNKRGHREIAPLQGVITQDFVPGCGMFFSRQVLLQVGLFDEKFFMYYEDSDLCLRIRDAGYKILTVPQAKMWHKVALSSGGSDAPNERYWMARSSIRYFSKHSHGWQRPFIIFWRTGSAIRTTWRLLTTDKLDSLKAYWRGLWHGIKEIGK